MKDNEFVYYDDNTHRIEIISVDGEPAEVLTCTKDVGTDGVEICVGEHYVRISDNVLQALTRWLEWSTTL